MLLLFEAEFVLFILLVWLALVDSAEPLSELTSLVSLLLILAVLFVSLAITVAVSPVSKACIFTSLFAKNTIAVTATPTTPSWCLFME